MGLAFGRSDLFAVAADLAEQGEKPATALPSRSAKERGIYAGPTFCLAPITDRGRLRQ
jgi:hypothetical protein